MNKVVADVCKLYTNKPIEDISLLGNGLINDTYKIKTKDAQFVLQQLNSKVFTKPDLVMENLLLLNKHIQQKNLSEVKLQIPTVITTINQQCYCIDDAHNFWRALGFIGNTESREDIQHVEEAEQVGFALAHFHFLMADAPIKSFNDTLPGFHITPQYFQCYQDIENKVDDWVVTDKEQFCKNFIRQFQSEIYQLESAKEKGILTERIIHGDPKLNNFLFDKGTNKIVSLIDLDTVKPGLVHYDIGDCLRSCCHIKKSNTFDLKLCEVILNSYLEQAGDFFTGYDYDYLYPAIQLIPFELGLRFYTDYLQGNRYFKVDKPMQNLDRAYAQFCLCESIKQQKPEIKQMISGYRYAL